MSKIISVHSFRGGTGKSNTTANLAVTLARKGNRVAVVDTDIQSPGIHAIFGKPIPSDHAVHPVTGPATRVVAGPDLWCFFEIGIQALAWWSTPSLVSAL